MQLISPKLPTVLLIDPFLRDSAAPEKMYKLWLGRTTKHSSEAEESDNIKFENEYDINVIYSILSVSQHKQCPVLLANSRELHSQILHC